VSILVFVPERLTGHVRHVLAGESPLVFARSWIELNDSIRRDPIEVAVVDPAADGIFRQEAMLRLMAQFPSLPLIAYVTVGPPSMRAVHELSKKGLEHVVMHRFDDSGPLFRQLVQSVRTNPLSEAVLRHLAPLLESLPLPLADVIRDMFEHPQQYSSALDVAVAAGMPSVRLYRSFDSSAFGSPKKLVIASKMVRGWAYLRDPGYGISDVASKVGYKYVRSFSEHALSVFGMTATKMRLHLGRKEMLHLLVEWLKKPAGSDDAPDLDLETDATQNPRHRRSG
jgi:AraC-like DNA-binding protein